MKRPGGISRLLARSGPITADLTMNITRRIWRKLSATARCGAALAAGTLFAADPTVSVTTPEGATQTFTSRLPLVVMEAAGAGLADGVEGNFRLFESETPSVDTPAGLKFRGSSSVDFPKKSFSIELHDSTGGNRKVALLGMARTADWALVGPWLYDPSYIRNAFAYALSNELGRWAPRTRFVEYFTRESGAPLSTAHYAGIGVLTERIKIASDLVAIQSLGASDVAGDAVTGGYILKFDPPDDDEYSWVTDRGIPADSGATVGTRLVVASPKAAKLAPEQQSYIRGYVQSFEDALFADRAANWSTRRHLDYIDRASWVDFHLLQVLTKNPDGLVRSAYFHKDRGGKIVAGPVWDFDRAMGSVDPRADRWDEWSEASEGAPLWETGWWGVLAQDPDFMQAWVDRWQSLRRTELSDAALAALVERVAGEVDPDAAARDAARWIENASRFEGGWRGEVEHLAAWLARRGDWIDQQFVAPPVVVESGGQRRISAPAGAWVVHTVDGSDPRASGGAPSGGAQLSAGTVVVPAGATYRVRIQRTDFTGGVGSPWSSSIEVAGIADGGSSGGGGSTVASLMNLSTRGTVEEGRTLVSGITVTGTVSQDVIVRAVGPTLARFGVGDALADPVVRVLAADGREVATNRDWRLAPDAASLPALFASVGAFALDASSRDAALRVSLAPGGYTLEVSSASGGRGSVLAELYAANGGTSVRNLSSLTVLADGASLIGGVAITAAAPRRVLVRAVGPALAQFGVGNAMSDTTLTVYSGARAVASNDDWSYEANASEIATAAASTGAFELPPGGTDAALLLTLEPGTYTMQAGSKTGEGGAVLLEIYELP